MSLLHILAILAAGLAAGTINTVVGSGTLITFPLLLGLGYAPVVANVSNTVGLVPGSATGSFGYRRELAGQRRRVMSFACVSLAGGIVGAVLLLSLPASAFKAIVPAFIGIALVLILIQPRLSSRLAARQAGERRGDGGPLSATGLGVFGAGVYGGYFGAAQGILLISILALGVEDELQRLNALKVVLTGLVNLVSGLVFVMVAHVAWAAAGLIAAGSIVGGVVGARFGRRLPPAALRIVIVIVGVAAIIQLV
ncbi:MAG: sulfite exporter TauE/SafE family protein [Solirubrobacteraceae bacterium]